MYGMKFRLEIPYFCTFKKRTFGSVIKTYTIPPFTTIRGLISSTLGLQRYDYRVQDDMDIRIGIKIVQEGILSKDMVLINKLKNGQNTPMYKDLLFKPIYDIFVEGKKNDIEQIYDGLKNPYYFPYLGDSEGLVNITPYEICEVKNIGSGEVKSVVKDRHPGCKIEKIPYKFNLYNSTYKNPTRELTSKTISIPLKNNYVELDTCYEFDNEVVDLL